MQTDEQKAGSYSHPRWGPSGSTAIQVHVLVSRLVFNFRNTKLSFLCSPSRFLRKNECKRHELSHTGIRPFSCHLCPYPSTTFVRQDLLKRHMKRTHRMQLKSDKENQTPDHPKKRARYQGQL